MAKAGASAAGHKRNGDHVPYSDRFYFTLHPDPIVQTISRFFINSVSYTVSDNEARGERHEHETTRTF